MNILYFKYLEFMLQGIQNIWNIQKEEMTKLDGLTIYAMKV